MARVAWSFASYSFPINPEKDSGWVYDHVMSEQVPIQATESDIQFGGRKSPRRQVSGWIWGSSSSTFFAQFDSWRRNRTQGTLTDHLGNSRSAILVKFEPEAINDPQAWAEGRQTWRYTAEFVGR
jgi:hypothetical protein